MCKQAETFWEDRVAGRDGATVPDSKASCASEGDESREEKSSLSRFVRTVHNNEGTCFLAALRERPGEALGFPPGV